MRRPSILLLLAALAACGSTTVAPGRPVATFVQLTDPHLFLQRHVDPTTGAEVEDTRRDWEERLDREALRSALADIAAFPANSRPQFIVVTGDWGVDTTVVIDGVRSAGPSLSAAAAQRAASSTPRLAAMADTIAAIVNSSAVKRFYWVPGNNDVVDEAADTAALARADMLTALVTQRLTSGATFENIAACYVAGTGSCTTDVSGTSYTLLGVPTVSFKNSDSTKRLANLPVQDAMLSRAEALLSQAVARGRRVILITHIPELDDPYLVGMQRYAGARSTRPALNASAWNVSDTALTRWKRVVESPAVTAVLAGHFHDSHREVYAQPYSWAEVSAKRASTAKLFVTPPLSVKNQEASPVQARGYAVFGLFADSVSRRIRWLDPGLGRFDDERKDIEPSGGRGVARGLITMLWTVTDRPNDLARLVVWALAIIVAFLSAVALWRIPPVNQSSSARVNTPAPTGTDQQSSQGVFDSNYGRIVLSGLGGMAAVAALDSFWTEAKFNAKAYYVAVFIVFFFIFLLAAALLRGAIEAFRARVLVQRQVSRIEAFKWNDAATYLGRQLIRLLSWIRSWFRQPLLVFFDTALQYLLGRNQSASEVWEKKIIDLQESIVAAVERVRDDLTVAVRNALTNRNAAEASDGEQVRVAITALSDDGQSVFYVARPPGSLSKPFPVKSVAWVAVQSGEARWWTKGMELPDRQITLFDNSKGTIQTVAESLKLSAYFDTRSRLDYDAFIVIPVPWNVRDLTGRRRPGAIHISFAHATSLSTLWPATAPTTADAVYDRAATLLERPGSDGQTGLPDEALRISLRLAADVLGELLSEIDQPIFERTTAARRRTVS